MSGIFRKENWNDSNFWRWKFVPVTVVEAGPNFVLQKKTEEKDWICSTTIRIWWKERKKYYKTFNGNIQQSWG